MAAVLDAVSFPCVSPEHALEQGEWDGVLLSDIVQCPRCGVVDEYAIAESSTLG